MIIRRIAREAVAGPAGGSGLLDRGSQLGLGLILFTAGARLIPVAEASLIAVLETILGPIWVWLAIGESPGPRSLLGGAVVLGALAIHTALDLRRPRAPAAAPASASGSSPSPSAPATP